MTFRIKLSHAVAALVAGVVLVGGGYALASSQQTTIHACVSSKTHVMLQESRCARGYHALTWSITGPKGERGAKGPKGATGAKGASGAKGATGTTGSQGVQGAQGAPGTTGNTGNTGPAGPGLTAWAQIWMSSSTDEIAPGSSSQNVASAVASGGTGVAYVDINGCSAEGLSEPVIQVSSNDDPSDNLSGADTPAGATVAWVAHWSKIPDFNTLSVQVDISTVSGNTPANADFAISVTC